MILVHVGPTTFPSTPFTVALDWFGKVGKKRRFSFPAMNPIGIKETPMNDGRPTIKIMQLGFQKVDADERLLMVVTINP